MDVNVFSLFLYLFIFWLNDTATLNMSYSADKARAYKDNQNINTNKFRQYISISKTNEELGQQVRK